MKKVNELNEGMYSPARYSELPTICLYHVCFYISVLK